MNTQQEQHPAISLYLTIHEMVKVTEENLAKTPTLEQAKKKLIALSVALLDSDVSVISPTVFSFMLASRMKPLTSMDESAIFEYFDRALTDETAGEFLIKYSELFGAAEKDQFEAWKEDERQRELCQAGKL